MSPNILVTGGAGYIGGSVLAELLSSDDTALQGVNLSTTVRSEEQIQALSKLGVNILQIDLNDEAALLEAVLQNEIDIVVHTASSAVPDHARNLIRALGQRRKHSGNEVYYIHSGITALFTEEAGWPFGEVKDSDNIYEKEKQIGPSNPVRAVDILVVEESKAQGVTAFNVAIPNVYGKGNGEWKKISVSNPSLIRTSIKHKTVHKFEKDSRPTQAHIADLSKLYALLVSKIIKKAPLPSGEHGYFFAFSHNVSTWSLMQRFATSLHDRGLVSNPEPVVWPSYETAADYLGWPRAHVRAMGTNNGTLISVNAYKYLGWQPQWTEEMYLDSVDTEIDDVLKYDTIAPSLFKPLMDKGE